MISSRLREKELESFVIEDQPGAARRFRALAGEPDGPRRVPFPSVTNRIEGGPARDTVTNDSRRPDLRAAKLDRHHFDQTDKLIGIPRADLRPRHRLGLDGYELFDSIHASIFAGRVDMASSLTSPTVTLPKLFPSLQDGGGGCRITQDTSS
jgi:hypothetical protein